MYFLGTIVSYVGIAALFVAMILARIAEVPLYLPLALILLGLPTTIAGLRARDDLVSAGNLTSGFVGLAAANTVLRFEPDWPWPWLTAMAVALIVSLCWYKVLWPQIFRLISSSPAQPN